MFSFIHIIDRVDCTTLSCNNIFKVNCDENADAFCVAIVFAIMVTIKGVL